MGKARVGCDGAHLTRGVWCPEPVVSERGRPRRDAEVCVWRIGTTRSVTCSAHPAARQLRLQCEAEKQALGKQFEQRIAGMRLEKEQAKIDKGVLKRLEKELGELKTLSTSVLGPLARWQQPPGGGLTHQDE